MARAHLPERGAMAGGERQRVRQLLAREPQRPAGRGSDRNTRRRDMVPRAVRIDQVEDAAVDLVAEPDRLYEIAAGTIRDLGRGQRRSDIVAGMADLPRAGIGVV